MSRIYRAIDNDKRVVTTCCNDSPFFFNWCKACQDSGLRVVAA